MATKQMTCPSCWGSKWGKDKKHCAHCKGMGTINDVPLSPHFWLSEFLRSDTAIRRGIPNVPTPQQVENLRVLCVDLLEPIREHFGPIRINSGFRCRELNTALSGASSTSVHPDGNAADFDPINPKVTFKQVINWVIEKDLPYDQVIYEGTWLHIGRFGPGGKVVRKQKKMMFPNKAGKQTFSVYDPNDSRLVL